MATVFTVGGVPCSLYLGEDGQQGGIRESYGEDGPHATMVLQCAWDLRFDALNALRGGVISGARVPPVAYPYSDNLYCLRVTDCVGIRYNEEAGVPGFKLARITAEFGVPGFDYLDHDPTAPYMDPSGWAYTTTTMRTSAEFFSPPTGAYYWELGPDAAAPVYGANVGKLITKTEYSIKVHWMNTGDIPGIGELEGTVNLYPVQIGQTTYTKGTLLFASGNTEVASESFGGRLWNYDYVMIGNGKVDDATHLDATPEWNEYMTRNGGYYPINTASDGSGKRVYRYTDFWNQLPR